VVVASEPYDDDTSWEAVPDRSAVEFDGDKLVVRPF
jgi:predicted glutamine amidotransferase